MLSWIALVCGDNGYIQGLPTNLENRECMYKLPKVLKQQDQVHRMLIVSALQ